MGTFDQPDALKDSKPWNQGGGGGGGGAEAPLVFEVHPIIGKISKYLHNYMHLTTSQPPTLTKNLSTPLGTHCSLIPGALYFGFGMFIRACTNEL